MIYIIIPVHNRVALTLQCLQSLYSQTMKEFRIILIDDGSSDHTVEIVSKQFPSLMILLGDGNLWWTGGTNAGIRSVLSKALDGDYILLLNNDTIVPENYLHSLLQSAHAHPNCLIGSVAIDSKDRKTILDGGVCIDWYTAKYTCINKGRSYDSLLNEIPKIQFTNILSGRGTLIGVNVFKNIGMLNENALPQYGADYEFTARAERAGYALIVDYSCFLYSNSESTGIRNERGGKIDWGDFIVGFFSRRSPNNLLYRWKFAFLTCPKHILPSYFFLDTLRVIIGGLRNQLISTSKMMRL